MKTKKLLFLFFFALILSLGFVISCDKYKVSDCPKGYFENEEIVGGLDEDVIIFALSQDSVQDKSVLISEVDKRLQNPDANPSFLDGFNFDVDAFREARDTWWRAKGYESEGAQILSFDGDAITTKGEGSTTFLLSENRGSTITKEGCLKTEDFNSCNSNLLRDEEGILNIEGGVTDFLVAKSPVKIFDGEFIFNGRVYSSNSKGFFAFFDGEGIDLSGEKIMVANLNGEVFSEANGKFYLSPEALKLYPQSSYSFYSGSELTRVIYADSPVIYSESNYCEEGINCILNNENNFLVKAREGDFYLTSYTDHPAQIKVEQIEGDSRFFFTQGDEVEVLFSEDPIRVKGDFSRIEPEIENSFLDKKGNLHNLFVQNGEIIRCSNCVNFCMDTLVTPRIKELTSGAEGREFLQEIRAKYGKQAELWYLNYLSPGGNPRVYKGVISASQNLQEAGKGYISPQFIYVGAVAEGLDKLSADGELNSHNIDGFFYLGLDTFGDNAATLRRGGYLPSNFNEGDEYAVSMARNEKGETVHPGIFNNVEVALQAKAAEYSWRRDLLLTDLGNLGINQEDFSRDELDFWTYVYYNSGPGTGKKMLESYSRGGYLKDDEYIWRRPTNSWQNPHLFANRRMANLKLVEESGIIFY